MDVSVMPCCLACRHAYPCMIDGVAVRVNFGGVHSVLGDGVAMCRGDMPGVWLAGHQGFLVTES